MNRLAAVGLALLVVLAGCNALAPQQSSNDSSVASPTDTAAIGTATSAESPVSQPSPTATAAPALPTSTNAGATARSSTTAAPTATPAPAGSSGSNGTDANGTDASGELPSAATVRTEALAAINAVDTYRVVVNQTTRLSGNVNRTTNAVSNGTFDRDAREASLTVTQSALGRTVTTERYLVNGTLYERNPQYVQQYDSAWIKAEVPDDGSAFRDSFDTLSRQRAILNASTVTLAGTETVDGTTTYRLKASPNATQLTGAAGSVQRSNLDVANVSATYWLDAETGLPVRSTIELAGQQTAQGQTFGIDQRLRFDFDGYGTPVSITLPPAAEGAVSVTGNASANGSETRTTAPSE